MLTREGITKVLRERYPYLAAEYSVKRIGLFGSYANEIPTEASDIDLVVEFERPLGFKFIELSEYLEKLLGQKVDVLTPAGIQGIRHPTSLKISGTTSYMSKRSDQDLLSDIEEAAQRIAKYTAGMTYEAFLSDR